MSLLEKILNLKLKNTSRIREADKTFLDGLQADFNKVWADFDIWEMMLNSKLQERFKDCYSVRYYGTSNEPSYSLDSKKVSGNFSDLYFFPGDTLEKIHELRQKLLLEFCENVTEYFNNEYNLSLSISDDTKPYREFSVARSYSILIDWIYSNLEGASLNDLGREGIIKSFRTLITTSTDFIAVKNTLVFKYLRLWGHGKISLTDSKCKTLFGAFSLFETGEFGEYMTGDLPISTYIDSGNVYPMNGQKITAIKFFQNGKGVLHFPDAATASEFVNFFGIELSTTL